MSNYLERTIPGEMTTYRRASRIELHNSQVPEARVFVVDRVTYPDGETVDKPGPQIDYQAADPTVEIPYIDPDTYEPMDATFTVAQFQAMAASVALWLMRGQE